MKSFLYVLTATVTSLISKSVFAAEDGAWIIGGNGITGTKLREGNVGFDDIPKIINNATNFVLGFAATVAVIMIIYGAFQMALFGLTSQEKKKWAETIQHGIIGFVIAVSSYFIISVVMSSL